MLKELQPQLVNCQAALNWTTESEINTERFEIEKGNSINSGWSLAGIVTAKGNSVKSEYSFIDKDLSYSNEPTLYRLRMVDKGGLYKYSKVVNVINNCKTIQVDVYPNPTREGKLFVRILGATTSAEATLISLTGQVILVSKLNNGSNSINISNITAGEYILNIKDANGFEKKIKVFIQH